MALFEKSDIENYLKGASRTGMASARFANNAIRKSFRNKQMLRSTQEFDTDDLVDQLKQVANDALRLEKALDLLRTTDPRNKEIKNYKNLLDSLNAEKQALSTRINQALASREAAGDVIKDIASKKTPLRRGRSVAGQSSNRATLGSTSLNLLGTAINVASYVGRKKAAGKAGNTSNLSSGGGGGDDATFMRQTLKISRDTYARDKEYQDEFKKDFDKVGDNIVRRLDKIIDKLDKYNRGGGGGGGGPPDIDLPDGEKKERRRGGRGRSRFGLRAGAAVAGTAGLVNGAKVIGPDGKETTLDMNPVSDILGFLTNPKVESAFQDMRNTAREFLGLSTAKPNTVTTNPSNNTTSNSPPTPLASTPATVIPPNRNFGGMPGLPRLNTVRPLSVIGGSEAAPAIKTNETDIDVKPQATVIINTKELEIKGGVGVSGGGSPFATVGSDSSVLGGVGGGIGGSGGIYSGSGAGTSAILGSRGGGRGQAFTPAGMQRQTITTNPFTGQPVMTLPSDAAGSGTAGGGIDNPYGFAGQGTGGFSAGNMGTMGGLPGSVTNTTITGGGSPKFLGPTSGGALGGLISSGEGGYGSYNKGIAGDSKDKIDFSQMSVADLMQRQSLSAGDPNRIFAFGKYQVIPSTMREAVKAMGIDPNSKVTPQLQEEIYRNYLISQKRPEVKDYITSQNEDPSKLHNAQQGLAKEFASVADPDTGASRYGGVGGNKASIGADKTSQALQEERRRYQENIKKGMKPEEAWSALSNPQGMDTSGGGATAGGPPTVPDAKQGETPGQLAARIKSLNPDIGNGECVALAKQAVGLDATPGANSVSDWRKGESATGRELPIGTPVATFMDRQGNDSDLYDGGQGTGISRKKNGGLGTTHAAVVAGYEKDENGKITGMQVWDQWNGSGGPRLRTIPMDPKKMGEDNAGNFYAINDSKGAPLGGANNPLSREAGPAATANGPVYDPTKTFGDPSTFSTPLAPAVTTPPTAAGNTANPETVSLTNDKPIDTNRNLDGTWGENHSSTKEGGRDLTENELNAIHAQQTKDGTIKVNPDGSYALDQSQIAKNLSYIDSMKSYRDPNPQPGESFGDYLKRRSAGGAEFGRSETDADTSAKFGEGKFNFEEKRQYLLDQYNATNKKGSMDNEHMNRIENDPYPQDNKTIMYNRNNRYNVDDETGAVWKGDEYTPHGGDMSLSEIRGYGPNASTNSSSEGSTRQSAAPPPAETSTPNPSDGGGGGSSGGGGSDKQSNPSDQKAVGEGAAPTLSEIPVKNDELGLAVINSYDL